MGWRPARRERSFPGVDGSGRGRGRRGARRWVGLLERQASAPGVRPIGRLAQVPDLRLLRPGPSGGWCWYASPGCCADGGLKKNLRLLPGRLAERPTAYCPEGSSVVLRGRELPGGSPHPPRCRSTGFQRAVGVRREACSVWASRPSGSTATIVIGGRVRPAGGGGDGGTGGGRGRGTAAADRSVRSVGRPSRGDPSAWERSDSSSSGPKRRGRGPPVRLAQTGRRRRGDPRSARHRQRLGGRGQLDPVAPWAGHRLWCIGAGGCGRPTAPPPSVRSPWATGPPGGDRHRRLQRRPERSVSGRVGWCRCSSARSRRPWPTRAADVITGQGARSRS